MGDSPRDDWRLRRRSVEAGIDVERANAARMYDYFLGGGHNFAVDRDVAARIAVGNPGVADAARANRAFLGEIVRWCVDHGIDQFLDLGSGVPTVGNVHEVAHQIDPDVRVAYVDVEPVAVAHAETVLAGETSVTVTRADVRDPASVLREPGVVELLDFDRPLALLAVAVLHFVEGDIADLMARYRTALAPGSAMAISHTGADQDAPTVARWAREGAAAYAESATPVTVRSRAELMELPAGLDLVEPGLVDVRDWPVSRPDRPGTTTYGALGRVR